MKNNQSHSGKNAFLDAVDRFLRDFAVRHVSPPEQHVGIVEDLLRETVFGLIERGGSDFDIRFLAEEIGDRLMNAFRIDFLNFGVLLFMTELVPDRDSDFPTHNKILRL